MSPKTYSVRAAARILGYTLTHVYKIIWAGTLHATKNHRGGWVVSQSDIDAYKRDHARNPDNQ